MFIYLLFIMFLLHIIDDFVMQPVCLSKLKQKSWWEQNCPDKEYKDDYITACFIHALSWSIMIHLPIIIWCWHIDFALILSLTIMLNAVIHFGIDNAKANEKSINLTTDQTIHFIQIFITWLLYNILLCLQ